MSQTATDPIGGSLTDDAAHPLETEAVAQVRRLLARRWMWQRVRLEVRFVLRSDEASAHDMSHVGVADGLLYGRARLLFNYLFLVQGEGVFLEHIVAHECAHLLAYAEAYSGGFSIERHGMEWQDQLARLSSQTPPTSAPVRELGASVFDGRAVKLLRGGSPAVCDCSGGYHVFTGGRVKRIGRDSCKQCGATYRAAAFEDAPHEVQQAYEYISDERVYRG